LTLIAATGAIVAACYTRQQWITADDTEKRQLRAYIVVTAARFGKDETMGKFKRGICNGDSCELLIYYDVSNEGITPAYDLEKLVDVQFPYTGTLEFRYTDGTAAYLAKQHTFGPVRTRGFSDEEINAIASGNPQFAFAGQITYRDIFGNQWPTNFCFVYAARPIEAGFDFCPRRDKTDQRNYAR
jgi:hypothetical protein